MTAAGIGGRAAGRAVALAAVVALLVALGLLLASGPAAAQTPTTTCDPTYGCTATTPPSTVAFTCHAKFTGTPGGPQVAIIYDSPPNQSVQVSFNGSIVGRGTTDGSGNAQVPFQLTPGTPGSFVAVLVGGVAHASCDPPVHWDGKVLGTGKTNPPGSTNGGGGHGVLAFTGLHLLAWLLIAAALVGLGLVLRRAGRVRRGHHTLRS